MSIGVIEQLDEAISALLDVDPDELGDDELHDTVVELQRQRARLGAAAAKLISRWDHRRVWAGNGSASAASRLSRDTRCSLTSARVELRRARQSRTMPHTLAAVAAGELSLDHIDLLGRANQPWRNATFADHEQMLVDECTQLRFANAVRAVDYWCQLADAEAAEDDAQRKQQAAHLYASPSLDGNVYLNGQLDPVGGATFTAELDRLERELYLADERDGVTRTASQRRAAALVMMAERSATAPADGQKPKPLFTVLLGDDTFRHLCELANGTVITPGTLTPWLGDADLETVLFDGPSTVISVSKRRTFIGALRRAIQVRDRHCQHPSGCDTPADECDIDHIVPHARGGNTSQFNGRLECRPHNRQNDKHDHHATPHPPRPVTRLDELRARLRWRYHHTDADRGSNDDTADEAV